MNIFKKPIHLRLLLGLALIVTAFQNCSQNTAFSASPASASSCTNQLQTITAPVKLLFVVDMSGSNADDSIYAGSDNNKTLRGGSIQKFFNDYSARSNFSWGFIVFNGTTARSLIGSSSQPTVSANAAQMQSAINTFYSLPDNDLTPYLPALQMARQAIANDTTATSTTKYIVVFLSDGYPDPAVDQGTLQTQVTSIVGMRPGQVTFNTIFYGYEDPSATALLSAMASSGGGKFLDTNANPTGSDFEISQEINVPGTNCTP